MSSQARLLLVSGFKLKVGKPTGVNVNAAPVAAPVPMLVSNDDDIPF